MPSLKHVIDDQCREASITVTVALKGSKTTENPEAGGLKTPQLAWQLDEKSRELSAVPQILTFRQKLANSDVTKQTLTIKALLLIQHC